MSGIDVKAISPVLKKRLSDEESKTTRKEKFARIRNAINRRAKPKKKKD